MRGEICTDAPQVHEDNSGLLAEMARRPGRTDQSNAQPPDENDDTGILDRSITRRERIARETQDGAITEDATVRELWGSDFPNLPNVPPNGGDGESKRRLR